MAGACVSLRFVLEFMFKRARGEEDTFETTLQRNLAGSTPEQGFSITSPMDHTKDENVLSLDAVHDDIVANSNAPRAGAEILVAGAPEVLKAGKKEKTVRDGVNQPVGDFDTAALLCDVIPDIV